MGFNCFHFEKVWVNIYHNKGEYWNFNNVFNVMIINYNLTCIINCLKKMVCVFQPQCTGWNGRNPQNLNQQNILIVYKIRFL